MPAASPIDVTNSVTYQAPASDKPAASKDGISFGEVLSDLNPLQYLPVVGTIYRAVTGDTIPKPLREAGSLVVSGLMGGPIGLATNLAMLAIEKLTGVDVEDVEQSVLDHFRSTPAVTQTDAAPATTPEAASSAHVSGEAWTPAQLAAFGVVTRADGTLQQGALTGADVLNALQLSGKTLTVSA